MNRDEIMLRMITDWRSAQNIFNILGIQNDSLARLDIYRLLSENVIDKIEIEIWKDPSFQKYHKNESWAALQISVLDWFIGEEDTPT